MRNTDPLDSFKISIETMEFRLLRSPLRVPLFHYFTPTWIVRSNCDGFESDFIEFGMGGSSNSGHWIPAKNEETIINQLFCSIFCIALACKYTKSI